MSAIARRLAALALFATLLAGPAAAAGPERADSRVRWSLGLRAPREDAPIDRASLAAAAARRLARERLAAADTAGADSALGSEHLATSLWAWESAERRAAIASARGELAEAARILQGCAADGWPEADRAAWMAERARVRAARADSAGALELARLVIRLTPGLPAASRALRTLEAVRSARAETLTVAEQESAVDVETLRGDRAAASRRLIAMHRRAAPAERGALALRIAELARLQRRAGEAESWADSALAGASDAAARERARLERARIRRAERTGRRAIEAYASLLDSATDPVVRSSAAWELGREAQDRGEYAAAERAFVQVAESAGHRADDARTLAGLCAYARGGTDAAIGHWRRSSGEAAMFWEGVALRARSRQASGHPADAARGDSLLRRLAERPGYRFHRAAARETLAVRGWPGTLVRAGDPDSAAAHWLGTARALAAEGDTAAALAVAQRWAAGDPRAGGARRHPAASWLDAAELAYGLARPDLGTRWVDRAIEASGDSAGVIWAAVPWAYPPAFESHVRGVTVDSLGLDAALLWGLMRQESRFDPRARSVSNALGLTQLLLPTAGDVARWLRDPPPTEARLFEPATGVRYGARYLAHLLGRFDRRVGVALAAYNAGPGTIRPDWRALIDRGGEALFCEFASNADSQEYARRILGFRSAYRELAPTSAP